MASIIPELSAVQSEALQEKVRSLLPSQQGFGADLVAQNVIVPIIDLTQAAEGSAVPQVLQEAYAVGSNSFTSVNATSTTIINNAGFWRITGSFYLQGSSDYVEIELTDGTTPVDIFTTRSLAGSEEGYNLYFTVFLKAGDSVIARAPTPNAYLDLTYRQIADVNGVLINPSGFTPQ